MGMPVSPKCWQHVGGGSGNTTMRREKTAKLTRKGWKVGAVREFLGLSTEEQAYVELRLRLASSLRNRRQRMKLSQAGLAERIGSSQSRVAKMEADDPSVSIDLLVWSLFALGATNRDLARAISHAVLPKAS
jgi:ribosome-binding protein aMBF1 (putative translation factor)